MTALKRMPSPINRRSPVDLALSGFACVRTPPCSNCGAMAAYLGFLKKDSGTEKVTALRKIWPSMRVEELPGGFWIRLPKLLAMAQYEFEHRESISIARLVA